MMNRVNKGAIAVLFLVLALFAPLMFGGTAAAQNVNCQKESAGFLNFPTWYKYLEFDEGSEDCTIDFNIETDIAKVLLAVFEIIIRLAGMVAVGFVVYGGFQYVVSQGEPDRIKGARSTILNALIGLAIALSATAIVNLIGQNIV